MNRELNICLAAALTCLSILFAGCNRSEESSSSKIKWTDPKKLEPGPIRHASLTDEQMSRAQRLQKVFSEVDPSPADKWVDDFKRDANPESELRIWESMATVYETFTASNTLALDAKKEAYQVVLLRSGAPEGEVLMHLKLKILTERDARNIMALFTNKPEPIKVVSP